MGQKSSLMLQDEEIKQISEETAFSQRQIEKLYSRFCQLDRANCGSLCKDDLLSISELALNPLCERIIEMFVAVSGKGVERAASAEQDQGDGEEEEEQRHEKRINFRQFARVLSAFRASHQPANGDIGKPATSNDEMIALGSGESVGRHHKSHDPFAPNKFGPDGTPARDLRRALPRRREGRATSNERRERDSHSPIGSVEHRNLPLNGRLSSKLFFVFKIYDVDGDGRISFTDLRAILKLMVGNFIEPVQLDKIATRAFVEVDQDNDGFLEFAEFCKVFAGRDMDDKLRVKFF